MSFIASDQNKIQGFNIITEWSLKHTQFKLVNGIVVGKAQFNINTIFGIGTKKSTPVWY